MTLTIGLGCRRGVAATCIDAAVQAAATCLLRAQPTWAAMRITQMATIDAKRNEAGLLAYCNRRGLALRYASADALAAASETAGSAASAGSEAVIARFGIPGVCEAAALWAAALDGNSGPMPTLVLRKMVLDGVTVAIALRPSGVMAPPAPPFSEPRGIADADHDDVPTYPFISLYELAQTDENRS